MEQWRTVERNPAYEVSSLGRVRRSATGHVLSPVQNYSRAGARPGYLKVHLGGKQQAYVHQLVCEAFHGPRPEGHDVDHENWNRFDNRAENVRWLPQRENRMRWKGPGRTDFVVGKHEDRIPPEGHVPLSEEEADELHTERVAAGW